MEIYCNRPQNCLSHPDSTFSGARETHVVEAEITGMPTGKPQSIEVVESMDVLSLRPTRTAKWSESLSIQMSGHGESPESRLRSRRSTRFDKTRKKQI
jgi:hypothetical protein